MLRAYFLGLLSFLLLLLGLATLRGAILLLALPLVVYLFYGFWRGAHTVQLEASRTLGSERVPPNTPVHVKVTITNHGDDLEELVIQDIVSPHLKVIDGSLRHLISLPKGGSYQFEYILQGPRGGYPLEALAADGYDHTGLIRVTRTVKTSGQLFITPAIVRLKGVSIRPRRTRVYAGTIPARVGGPGVEFFGVRDYQPGDSPRHINWRIAARHGEELYSNEYQQERVADVAVVLDGRVRSNLFIGGHSLFEHSVLAAGTLADALLSQGNRVGLLIYGHYLKWTWPGYGKLQRERILHALSHAEPGSSQVFDGLEYLPTRMFPPESQIILVSPLMEEDYETLVQLRARGYQVLVVSPDPVKFEQRHLPVDSAVQLAARIVQLERGLLVRNLKRAGVQVVDWDVDQPFDQAAGRFLLGHRAQARSRF